MSKEVKSYEHIGTKEKEQAFGMFYTPPELVERLISKTDSLVGKKVLDNSCGYGGILLGVLQHKLQEESIEQALKEVYGIEIDEDNLNECKERIIEFAVANGLEKTRARVIVNSNIILGDALEDYEFNDISRDNILMSMDYTDEKVGWLYNKTRDILGKLKSFINRLIKDV
jgi:type I restriction-modification system DNA methylase subunit